MSEVESTVTLSGPGIEPITMTEAQFHAAAERVAGPRFAKDQLKSIIERIERMEEEKATISTDIREIYSEAKGNGFDVKALRTIVKMRKQDPNERAEAETILETYMQALGML